LCYTIEHQELAKSKEELGMMKYGVAGIFLMFLCCGLPLILIALGLGTVGVFLQSNLLVILAAALLFLGIAYFFYRRHCNTCEE